MKLYTNSNRKFQLEIIVNVLKLITPFSIQQINLTRIYIWLNLNLLNRKLRLNMTKL